MSQEEFLLALHKEGLLINGTTWLENFKRLQELKKYKEMWEEVKKGAVYKYLDEYEQKYFPEPHVINWKDRFDELEEEFEESERELKTEIEYWKYLYHNKQY